MNAISLFAILFALFTSLFGRPVDQSVVEDYRGAIWTYGSDLVDYKGESHGLDNAIYLTKDGNSVAVEVCVFWMGAAEMEDGSISIMGGADCVAYQGLAALRFAEKMAGFSKNEVHQGVGEGVSGFLALVALIIFSLITRKSAHQDEGVDYSYRSEKGQSSGCFAIIIAGLALLVAVLFFWDSIGTQIKAIVDALNPILRIINTLNGEAFLGGLSCAAILASRPVSLGMGDDELLQSIKNTISVYYMGEKPSVSEKVYEDLRWQSYKLMSEELNDWLIRAENAAQNGDFERMKKFIARSKIVSKGMIDVCYEGWVPVIDWEYDEEHDELEVYVRNVETDHWLLNN